MHNLTKTVMLCMRKVEKPWADPDRVTQWAAIIRDRVAQEEVVAGNKVAALPEGR
jgi:hypothetical protein